MRASHRVTRLWVGTSTRRGAVGIVLCAAALFCGACGRPYRAHQQLTLAAAVPTERLEVTTHFGDISINADPQATEIRADVIKRTRGTTRDEADLALDDIEIVFGPKEGEPGVVEAAADFPKHTTTREYEVEWRLTVPPETAVVAHSSFGDVDAIGLLRGVRIHTAFGDVEVEAAGPIRLYTKFGDVDLNVLPDNPGDVTMSTSFGDASVRIPEGREGLLTAETSYGDVSVRLGEMWMRRLHHVGDHLEVQLGDVKTPEMTIHTSFGDVVVRAYQPGRERAAGED